MKSNLEIIGLDAAASKKISEKLNLLLANYQLFYMNTRGFHWNIKGPEFFQLHSNFETLYDDLVEKVDEIAERILMIGGTPAHSFTEYLKIATVKEAVNVSDKKGTVENIINTLGVLIGQQREILALAAEAGDEGTVALMSDYISGQEKLVWMYNATRA